MSSLGNHNSDFPASSISGGQPNATPPADQVANAGATVPPEYQDVGDALAPVGPRESSPSTFKRIESIPGKGNWRWWVKLIVQPLIFALSLGLVFLFLGLAQQAGMLTSHEQDANGTQVMTSEASETMYICPMMCVAPTTEPGRCPVCAMELVPAASSQKSDGISISIDAETRRILNIQTAPVVAVRGDRILQAVGELNYDESRLKTLAAYVDGRIEALYANYTGFVVNAGESLALVYSPRLYSTQVEYLSSIKSEARLRSSGLSLDSGNGGELRQMSRTRLREQGMTAEQIYNLEQGGEAESRIRLLAPISGTVIEKLAVEGQYVKEGDPIYRLADLSTVWLSLRLFPEDAALIREGQEVDAEVQSFPGESFLGKVAFVFPSVDPLSRTVNVRVALPNPNGRLRIGDYATATIRVPLTSQMEMQGNEMGMANGEMPATMIPRSALLKAGQNSVVYVETEPGRFEIRPVSVGATTGNQVVILSGLKAGEQVAIRGNFLIDSQMQLSGNASLIDPSRAIPAEQPEVQFELTPEIELALEPLTPADRTLVLAQQICPVAEMPLGSMGTPIKVDVRGTPVFICCEGCRKSLLDDPDEYFGVLEAHKQKRPNSSPEENGPKSGSMQPIDPEIPPMGEITILPRPENATGGNEQ